MDSPFHPGEQQIQSRLGMRDKLEDIGRRMIRDHMPEQHREFFALLPWLLVGSRDADGQPQASVLWGAPGFTTSPQPQRLRIDSMPEADDPLAANLRAGTGLGLLGIELPTRRRNRMNGRVEALSDGGFAVVVQQSFGNCPKYIQVRSWQAATRQPGQLEQGEGLDPRWLPLVEGSDTLFIASSNGADMDISHRGGPRGFVRLARDGRLWLPDYSGNFMFNTLGNLLLEPRCALLWIDFASGDLLHLEARAELVWPEDYPEPAPPGAERMLALSPGRWRLRRGRLPLAFGSAEPSPFLPAQGH
ncbi:pyridoxamine 5'-phosphate oxidase family protein [Aquipseudomonas alcaligenes]|uniref:pyridoxamine 5'-phosphate oxidase family protein n=1 Tax=Aquipseudomonas alcaligenes TaxID=43263 RepID=UPI0007801205|nr:pyridoxamine 5'-phosphate oxidase family protein [Pseudomonas alcaligenes]AMR66890.1 pyridoxamine 5'-phosphate oxidase [Pseudomonas alcaligenes]